MATPATPPTCPRCGGAATWHPKPGQWGCDRCQQMLPPIQHPPLAFSPVPVTPPPPAPVPGAPPCPRCGYDSVWHPQMQNWGCDRCRLMNPQIPYIVPPSAPDRAGTTAIKVVVSIVLIVAAVALAVALRVNR